MWEKIWHIWVIVWSSEEIGGCLYLLLVLFFQITVHFGAAESYSMHQLHLLDKFLQYVFVDGRVMHFK